VDIQIMIKLLKEKVTDVAPGRGGNKVCRGPEFFRKVNVKLQSDRIVKFCLLIINYFSMLSI
jgi:hypothetical protein